MNHCKTCKYWSPARKKYPLLPASDDVGAGGFCQSQKLAEDIGQHDADMLVYSYSEGGDFWTGPDFGCVHHAPTPTSNDTMPTT